MARQPAHPRRADVLIVENQGFMRAILREFLESALPGRVILEAPDARRALELVRTHRPPLVLMDVNLEEANGIELTAQIKAELPAIEVIVISQYAGSAYVDHAEAAGALAYIVKEKIHTELPPLLERVFGSARGRRG